MAKATSKSLSESAKRAEQQRKDLPAKVEAQFRSLVFISHDSRDAELAEAFANLLADASGGFLKSFRSSDRRGTTGIVFGAEWYNGIMSKLDDATDVVALLTPKSIDRPWILYEAGVAKGKLNKQVFGVVVGLPLERASHGPFAQFHNCNDDEDSLTKLVLQLIRRNSDAEPREEAVRRQVDAFRGNIKSCVTSVNDGADVAVTSVDANSVSKLFEEIKVMLQDVSDRANGRTTEAVTHRASRRRPSLYPFMVDQLMRESLLGKGSHQERAAIWLAFISLLREEIPWIYELGMDVFKALRSQRIADVISAVEGFIRSVEAVNHSVLFKDRIAAGDRETHMMVRHLPEMMTHFLKVASSEKETTADELTRS